MHLLNRVYIKTYFIVLLLYVFFNKGVAYSYMAEILLVAGIFILFINRKNLELGLDSKQILVGVFILISFLFILIGIFQYSIFKIQFQFLILNFNIQFYCYF